MKKLIALCVFTFLLTGCFGPEGDKVVLKTNSGDHTFYVDVADDKEEREMGLQYKENLGDQEGMFFVYEEESKRAFWMPNMLISLDIIFLDKEYKVVDFFENVLPCETELTENCPHYIPANLAQYALEVNSGKSREIALKRGDVVQYN
ncbi:DUF192 domain-containing protein [Patescibacteria group bacterium]